ncbi:MAG: transglutaminase family protein [Cellvibrionaceae bacterium]|nr:transglutaminase family protein [Cellvibrionaceae bacterium]
MSWVKFQVTHTTEYHYEQAVSHCYNLAHMMPRNSYRQSCQRSRIAVEPGVVGKNQRHDYFGNTAYHFEIQRSHKRLRISAFSEVETAPQTIHQGFDFGISCAEALQQIAQPSKLEDTLAREFLLSSPLIDHQQLDIYEYAAESFSLDKPLLSCVSDLNRRIFQDFKYSPQATTIYTPLQEVLNRREGVCQDFAHLQIACLRAMGYPARYVSGYIETLAPPGKEKLQGTDASHAWVAVYSPAEGWVEFDPTNNTLANEQHIITAWGRDFHDVTPLKGIVYGGGKEPRLKVAVDVRRLDNL